MRVAPPKDFGGCLSVNGMQIKDVGGVFECNDDIGKELVACHGFTEVKTEAPVKSVESKPVGVDGGPSLKKEK